MEYAEYEMPARERTPAIVCGDSNEFFYIFSAHLQQVTSKDEYHQIKRNVERKQLVQSMEQSCSVIFFSGEGGRVI